MSSQLMARFGIVLAALLTVFLVTGCASDTIRNDAGEVVSAGDWSVFDVRPGDCIKDGVAGDKDMVPLIPCDEPHPAEVFSLVSAPQTTYPGQGELAAFSDQSCLAALSDLLGDIPDDLAFSFLMPTEETWVNNDDRAIVCLLVFPSGEAVGSFVAGTIDRATTR